MGKQKIRSFSAQKDAGTNNVRVRLTVEDESGLDVAELVADLRVGHIDSECWQAFCGAVGGFVRYNQPTTWPAPERRNEPVDTGSEGAAAMTGDDEGTSEHGG